VSNFTRVTCPSGRGVHEGEVVIGARCPAPVTASNCFCKHKQLLIDNITQVCITCINQQTNCEISSTSTGAENKILWMFAHCSFQRKDYYSFASLQIPESNFIHLLTVRLCVWHCFQTNKFTCDLQHDIIYCKLKKCCHLVK